MVKQEIADINLVGRNCVLVTDIFKRNINQTIVELEKRHKTRVEAAIYFNSYTGLGEKVRLKYVFNTLYHSITSFNDPSSLKTLRLRSLNASN